MKHFAIAGAGVAGLASAILLRQQGHQVSIFDQVADPTPVGAGILLQPSGQAVLARLGLLDAVKAQAGIVQSLQGYTGRRLSLDMHYAHLNPEWHGLGIHRASLHKILWDAALAAGAQLQLACPISQFQQFARGESKYVQLEIKGQQQEFDALLIANGTRSHLREKLPIAQTQQAYPWGAYWAVLDSDDWPFPHTLLQRYRGAHIMMGVLPTGSNPLTGKRCYSLFWSLPRSQFAQLQAQGISGLLAQMEPIWPEVAQWLSRAIAAATTHIAIAEYADVRMDYWHHQHSLVIGDAAHAMSPQLGQGANIALIDAYILAQCLHAQGNIEQAFANYSARRAKHIKYYQFASRIMTPLYQSHYPISWLRDFGTMVGRKISPVYRQYLLTLCGAKQGNFDMTASIDRLLDGA